MKDADRNCTPVDCAIKYKGKRNFYRNSTGKCEKVVPCNTRGIGNKVIAVRLDCVNTELISVLMYSTMIGKKIGATLWTGKKTTMRSNMFNLIQKFQKILT